MQPPHDDLSRAAPPAPGARHPDPAGVDPVVLSALLDRHGWRRRGGTAGRCARWMPPGRAPGAGSLLVPESRSFPGSEDLLGAALTALARSAVPSAREVLLGLTVPSDEIRWRREVPQRPVPGAAWAVEEQLRSAARQLLMAGALAARGRAGYHGARHRRQAQASLEGVLVSPARGGRTLTAFVPAATARPVTLRLHQALRATREALDQLTATGRMDGFDAAVARGVSRELTEAVIALMRGSEGVRAEVEWASGAGAPEGCADGGGPLAFSPADLPALREAGARFLREEPSMPVRITGEVVRMRRSGPGGAGTVRLRVLAGAEVPYVRAALEPEAYATAGRAHLAGLPVRMAGRLESRGGFRRLTDASGVEHLPADTAPG
ncbi:hypothetical protein [Streptomyces sp. NPDC001985]|uniref:hypothetical protein n=1 Tax=Streptomyces sp. NPDC001985 TaxID=3154406 RepID=UPI0033277089